MAKLKGLKKKREPRNRSQFRDHTGQPIPPVKGFTGWVSRRINGERQAVVEWDVASGQYIRRSPEQISQLLRGGFVRDAEPFTTDDPLDDPLPRAFRRRAA